VTPNGYRAASPVAGFYSIAVKDIGRFLAANFQDTQTAAIRGTVFGDVNGDGAMDNTNPLYFDGTQQMLSNQIPVNDTAAYQVFEITALAVTPAGSQRIVQYTVSPTILGLSFPSALTFDGPGPVYSAPDSNPFNMNGSDRSGSNPLPGCTVAVQPAKSALGVVNPGDIATAASGIPNNRLDHYLGAGGTPSVSNVGGLLPPTEQSVASLQNLVQSISNVANNVLTGPVNGLSAAQLGVRRIRKSQW